MLGLINLGVNSFGSGILSSSDKKLNLKCKIDGDWKEAETAYVKIDGEWKEISEISII
jgi:cyanate lyase